MPSQVVMPALLPAATDGRLEKWYVAEGQEVAAGDVIAEIATGTATMEIEALSEGRVEKLLVPAGAGPIGPDTPIALIRVASGAPSLAPASPASAQRPDPACAPSGSHDEAGAEAMPLLTYREALREALAEEMRRDPLVIVLGPEVVQNRGAAKVCRGLADEFGPERVVATPPLEEGLTGLAIGAALQGLRPVVEFPSWASALQAIDLIQGEAASAAFLSAGTVSIPVVFRGPNGWVPGGAGPASHCFASLFAQVPGLTVLAPATPADAKGLLKAAIRALGPVVILEHERLYASAGPVPASADWVAEIGVARVARAGTALSIVAYGRAVATALEAADALSADGIEAEVVDLRSLRPLDLDTVLASVAKTRRLLTVEDGWPQASIGAEIVASVAARAFATLAAPPVRIAGADVPMPYAAELEALALPDSGVVAAAARSLVASR
jgi:pyruvate dehydrogenase E1 component beta subunit